MKYPVLLVHGIAARDEKILRCWGRIPDAMSRSGARVYLGGQDAWGSVEHNGRMLKRRALAVMEREGAEKVNIIAHSKGGLDSRYMIAGLGMGDRVASLTTISTPHRGSETVELLLKLPDPLWRMLGGVLAAHGRMIGDIQPDFCRALRQVSSSGCEEFNRLFPDVPDVFYQSYTGAMRNSFSDLMMCFQHMVVRCIEGENDGLVAVESAKWGEFQGVVRGGRHWGVSHLDTIDRHRKTLGQTDIPEFYASICRNLAAKGL